MACQTDHTTQVALELVANGYSMGYGMPDNDKKDSIKLVSLDLVRKGVCSTGKCEEVVERFQFGILRLADS